MVRKPLCLKINYYDHSIFALTKNNDDCNCIHQMKVNNRKCIYYAIHHHHHHCHQRLPIRNIFILHFWSYMKRAFNIYKLANEKSDIYVTVQRSRSFGNFVNIFLMKKFSLKRVRIIFFRSINHQDSTQSHPLINLLFYSGTGTIFFASLHFKSARQKLTEKR